jgi:hypothetical protein
MDTVQLLVVAVHSVVAIVVFAFGVRGFAATGKLLGLGLAVAMAAMIVGLGVVVGRVAARRD